MPRERLKDATNRKVVKVLYKRYLDRAGLINCDRCRYNRKENAGRQAWKSWKRLRKTQYKVKD